MCIKCSSVLFNFRIKIIKHYNNIYSLHAAMFSTINVDSFPVSGMRIGVFN